MKAISLCKNAFSHLAIVLFKLALYACGKYLKLSVDCFNLPKSTNIAEFYIIITVVPEK